MPTFLLTEIITVERLLVAIVWAVIVGNSLPCIALVCRGDARRDQLWMATIGIVGMGLLIFQYRALLGLTPVVADYWVAVALGLFTLAGFSVFAINILRARAEIQRGLIIVSVLAVISLVTAGVIAA